MPKFSGNSVKMFFVVTTSGRGYTAMKWSAPCSWTLQRVLAVDGTSVHRDVLSSIGWYLLCSTHILSLKCLRLPATKKWQATPNVKILVLSHPLGDLKHMVHLWLDGKRVVDFLLAIIEHFSLALTAAALGGEICRNRRFSTGCFRRGGSLSAQIFGRWGRRP